MSCQHVWERRDKQPWCLPYYICTECEMELSTSQYEAIQQAHRQGWEQAKREAEKACRNRAAEYWDHEAGALEVAATIQKLEV